MSEGSPIVLEGVAASGGLAVGRLALCHGRRALRRVAGTPAEERAALVAAMARAAAQLEALAAGAELLAAEILEFQIALLDDDELTEPILARIAAGTGRALHVLVDLGVGRQRTGCASTAGALAVARRIAGANSLAFGGVQAYAGHLQHVPEMAERARQGAPEDAKIEDVLEASQQMHKKR